MDPAFKYFVSAVQKNPDWKIPHRTTLSSEELDKEYAMVIAQLKEVFKDCSYLALTTDLCTGGDGVSYCAVTGSALDANFVLRESVLACVLAHANHSGENLADLVIAVLKEIGLKDTTVVAIVTDEGGGAPCIAPFFPRAVTVRCAAHRLQTCLRHGFDAAYDKYPLISSVLTIAKHLAAQYNFSSVARAELAVLQSMVQDSVSGLVQDVVTRWLSQYYLLKSIQGSETAVKLWINERHLTDPAMANYNPAVFWPLLNCLVDILEPFHEVTKQFSTERKPTLHLVIDNYLFLKESLLSIETSFNATMLSNDAKSAVSSLVMSLSQALTDKFVMWNDFELASYALFPDHRCLPEEPESEILTMAYDAVSRLLLANIIAPSEPPQNHSPAHNATLAASNNSAQGTAGHRLANRKRTPILPTRSSNELAEYKVTAVRDETETVDQFWTRLSSRFPSLSALARLVFSIPCSQTASERLFSLLRLTCSHLRGRLHPETINKVITCSVFINRRNHDLNHQPALPRTVEQEEADKARVISLLDTNKKRKRETAMLIESAAELATLDVPSILADLKLPPYLHVLDSAGKVANFRPAFLEAGDGEISDDDDFAIPGAKRRKVIDDEETPSVPPRPSQGCGKAFLTPSSVSKVIICGTWQCETSRPTPSSLFGKNVEFLEFLPSPAAESPHSVDPNGFLLPVFAFKLTAKGSKKFNGRRGFVSQVGEIILFE